MKFAIMLAIAMFVLIAGCAGNSGNPGNAVQQNSQQVAQGVNGVKASAQPNVAANGDTVTVDYVGTLENGAVFDTSVQSVAQQANLTLRPSYSPLIFVAGAGQMIPGFDSAVVGMKVGDVKTVTIPPEQAYGQWNRSNVVDVPLSKVQNSAGVKLGSVLTMSNYQGVVTGIANTTNGTMLTVDFNNRLAGHTLTFYIKMLNIQKA